MFFKVTNFFVFVLLVVSTLLTWLVLPRVTVSGADITGNTLVDLLNDTRQRQGLVTLKNNLQLQEAARRKGEDMLKKQYWAHFGPNKETPWDFITKQGYDYEYAGENLAKGFTTSEAVHTAWLNSPTHRDNLLNPYYDEVGIAVLYGEVVKGEGPIILVVQMFGSHFAGLKIPGAQQTVAAKVTIESPKEGEVVSKQVVGVEGSAEGVKQSARIKVGSADIAEVGIKDKRFRYEIKNTFDVAPLVITVSSVTPNSEARSDTVTVFNNPGDFIQNYYRERLTARQTDDEMILLAVPTYQNVLGIKLDSCDVEYPFVAEEGEWRVGITASQYEHMKLCANVLQVQVPSSKRLPLAIGELPAVTVPPTVAGVTTEQPIATRLARAPLNWGLITGSLLGVIGAVVTGQVVVSIRRNRFHLHHHYFALVLLFLISGLVKLFFSNGTIV